MQQKKKKKTFLNQREAGVRVWFGKKKEFD